MLTDIWAVTEPRADSLRAALQRHHGAIAAALEETCARVDPARLEARRGGVVAIVPVIGELMARASFYGTSTLQLAGLMGELAADKAVQAVVLEVDSGGGEISGVPEAASAVRALAVAKPIVSIARTWAGSAAYWIASQASEVLVSPSGEVGSIGVFAMHLDMSQAMEQMGVRVTVVRAGRFKGETLPTGPLTDEALAYVQSRVDEHYAAFVSDVAKGRRVGVESVRKGFGEGRMVGAKRAVELGMADSIGTLDDAIRRAVALAAERRRGMGALAEAQARRAGL
jgi:signal peptide peptidase SppA